MLKKSVCWAFIAGFLFLGPSVFAADQKLVERLDLSTQAFRDLMDSADASVPESLLQKAEAIVIFPRTINVAWGIGGQYGNGVAFKRDRLTGNWSAPAFYTIGGLTIGPQIGGQAIDIVLVVVNEKGLQSLLKSKSTLGADAGIAVGPAGRNATATTDLRLGAEIYSYSRAKGLYIGLSLKGAIVAPDSSSNEKYYGRKISAEEILTRMRGPKHSADAKLIGLLNGYTQSWFQKSWILLGLGAFFLLSGAFLFFKNKQKSV